MTQEKIKWTGYVTIHLDDNGNCGKHIGTSVTYELEGHENDLDGVRERLLTRWQVDGEPAVMAEDPAGQQTRSYANVDRAK